MTAEHPQRFERRHHNRVTLKTSVSIASESNFYSGLANDVSEGGLFVATHDVVAIGHAITLEFSFDAGEEPIRVQGEVRWIREFNPSTPDVHPGMGVQFRDLTEQDRGRIQRFVHQRATLLFEE
jgi:uncharacterized protein (TIGR02266 family)